MSEPNSLTPKTPPPDHRRAAGTKNSGDMSGTAAVVGGLLPQGNANAAPTGGTQEKAYSEDGSGDGSRLHSFRRRVKPKTSP